MTSTKKPVFYSDHEQPGDHILRAAMNRGQDQVIADRRARLNQAFKDLEPLCRGCRLYIDQPPKGDQTADLPDPESEPTEARLARTDFGTAGASGGDDRGL